MSLQSFINDLRNERTFYFIDSSTKEAVKEYSNSLLPINRTRVLTLLSLLMSEEEFYKQPESNFYKVDLHPKEKDKLTYFTFYKDASGYGWGDFHYQYSIDIEWEWFINPLSIDTFLYENPFLSINPNKEDELLVTHKGIVLGVLPLEETYERWKSSVKLEQ